MVRIIIYNKVHRLHCEEAVMDRLIDDLGHWILRSGEWWLRRWRNGVKPQTKRRDLIYDLSQSNVIHMEKDRDKLRLCFLFLELRSLYLFIYFFYYYTFKKNKRHKYHTYLSFILFIF